MLTFRQRLLVLRAMLGTQKALRARPETDTQTSTEHARLCAALDRVTTNVMVCDMELRIVFLNRTAMQMFRESETRIASDFPGFKATEIVGRCVDDFHVSPGRRRFRIADMQEQFTTSISFGGQSYKIIVKPVSSPDGDRIGAVVEWENLTVGRLRQEEENRRTGNIERILDVLGNLRVMITKEGEITDLNRQAAEYLGYDRASLIDAPVSKILPPGFTANMIGELAIDGVFQDMRCMLRHADGRSLSVNLFGLAEFENREKRQISQLMLLARPADSETRLMEDPRLPGYVVERVGDGIAVVDREWTVLSANRPFCEIIDIESAAIIGANLADIMPGEEICDDETGKDRWEREYIGKRRDRSEYTVLVNVHSLGERDRGGNRLITIKDVTRLKQSERHIRNLAYKDTLTGLANRLYFEQRVRESIKTARRRDRKLAILFFDLDGFKHVNDSLGHTAGDKMLRVVAERIRNEVRETDLVARLGGDEFCVLLEDIRHAQDASLVAGKCLEAISETCVLSGRDLQPKASVGITLCPDDGENYDALLRFADSAMYAAKQAGKNRYAFYSPELIAAAQDRLAIEHDLRAAVKNGSFELRYQPQIELTTGRMAGVEALVRWKREGRGLVAPDEFIPVVERIGLIEDLGEWVLNEACHQMMRWTEFGLGGLKVAVNISSVHFRQGRIVEPVRRILEATGLDPGLLQLEVTETAMQTESEAIETFRQLKKLGVGLAIDDFGTGFSCLNSIRRLPLDCLKVDKSFVSDLIHDPENSSIVATILAMGRAMGLTVVAEGVEEIGQVQYLSGLGCNLAQGYFFSKAVAADEIPLLAGKSFFPSTEAVTSNPANIAAQKVSGGR